MPFFGSDCTLTGSVLDLALKLYHNSLAQYRAIAKTQFAPDADPNAVFTNSFHEDQQGEICKRIIDIDAISPW